MVGSKQENVLNLGSRRRPSRVVSFNVNDGLGKIAGKRVVLIGFDNKVPSTGSPSSGSRTPPRSM
jgi:uncharacterized protein with ACT and thioredoxin-like domain